MSKPKDEKIHAQNCLSSQAYGTGCTCRPAPGAVPAVAAPAPDRTEELARQITELVWRELDNDCFWRTTQEDADAKVAALLRTCSADERQEFEKWYGNRPANRREVSWEVWQARAALLRSQGESRWIPVSERLPECGEWFFDSQASLEGYHSSSSVLVAAKEGVTVAHYAECTNDGGNTKQDDGWTSDHRNDSDKTLEVTHWRPLPSPPAETTK